jgi:large subunit ribosomal protein L16
MLSPKRVKFRKMFKGRTTGTAYRGSEVSFGHYGLQALEPGWVTQPPDRGVPRGDQPQHQARRQDLDPHLPRQADHKKPAETRMGKGKGSPEQWVAVVKPGG